VLSIIWEKAGVLLVGAANIGSYSQRQQPTILHDTVVQRDWRAQVE